MTLAIEPMINLGTAAVSLLDDGWTVRTGRWNAVGAFRAHGLDHQGGARNTDMARKDAIEVEGKVVELLPEYDVSRGAAQRPSAFSPIFREKCGSTSFASCQETKLC